MSSMSTPTHSYILEAGNTMIYLHASQLTTHMLHCQCNANIFHELSHTYMIKLENNPKNLQTNCCYPMISDLTILQSQIKNQQHDKYAVYNSFPATQRKIKSPVANTTTDEHI